MLLFKYRGAKNIPTALPIIYFRNIFAKVIKKNIDNSINFVFLHSVILY